MVSEAPPMIALFQVAQQVQELCQARGWRFCFIGGVALQRWGQPRVTQDVDLTLLTGFGDEEKYAGTLLARFPGRIADPLEFAVRYRVLLLQSEAGVPIDISLGALPYEELMVSRASDFQFLPEIALRTCSAEDLVILKAFADRLRDWSDIESILLRQQNKIDWRYVEQNLKPLVKAKEAPHILERLAELRGEGH